MGGETVRMLLFVARGEPHSRRAEEALTAFCAEELENASVEVVDVFEDFQRALEHDVMLTPTLIVLEPGPPAIILGDLRDMTGLRNALRLP